MVKSKLDKKKFRDHSKNKLSMASWDKLGEALSKEIERCEVVLKEYSLEGDSTSVAIRIDIILAHAAIKREDTVAMVLSYLALKEHEK